MKINKETVENLLLIFYSFITQFIRIATTYKRREFKPRAMHVRTE